MLQKIAAVGIAATLSAGMLATSAQEAEARHGRHIGFGIASGIIAGSILGGYDYAYGRPRYHSYSSDYGCYQGPRQCDWSGRSCWINHWGERICRGGEWHCWRPIVCD